MIAISAPFGRASRMLVTSKAEISQSNIARPMVASSDCQHWPPNWLADPVAAIVAVLSPTAAAAAKAATTTIPIVFAIGPDPVDLGLVSSLNRPGGNVTGVTFLVNALGGKRLELLHNLVPSANVVGFLINAENPTTQSQIRDAKAAART